MGLRERIEREVRAALRQAAVHGEGRVNVKRPVNGVVVRNVGGGTAAASAEQAVPIVQEPSDDTDATGD